MDTESISFSCKLQVRFQINPASHITQERLFKEFHIGSMQAQRWEQYINGSSYLRCGTDRGVMDIVSRSLWKWTQTKRDEDPRGAQHKWLLSDFLCTPTPHCRRLYITIIKKERTLLIKSINHTGGVGSSVHPLMRVSNQSSSLVMYSWEM